MNLKTGNLKCNVFEEYMFFFFFAVDDVACKRSAGSQLKLCGNDSSLEFEPVN